MQIASSMKRSGSMKGFGLVLLLAVFAVMALAIPAESQARGPFFRRNSVVVRSNSVVVRGGSRVQVLGSGHAASVRSFGGNAVILSGGQHCIAPPTVLVVP
jgi:hypothetical protein